MKKKLIVSIIILLFTLPIMICNNVNAQVLDVGDLKIEVDTENLKTDGSVVVKLLLLNQNEGISTFSSYFKYDREIFQEVTRNDIKANIIDIDEDLLDSLSYNKDSGKISIFYNEDISNVGTICTINLTVKDNVDITSLHGLEFELSTTVLYSDTNEDTVKYNDPIVELVNIADEPQIEALYLTSEVYKIGNSDITKYEEGDRYISRIEANTTKEDYISKLDTNGTIRILKEDGTELAEGEFVGTGMTLEVTKDNEEIELKIAVMGDLSGDGEISATDLSELIQGVLNNNLEDEYFVAADLDENDSISATDLSEEIKLLLI